jgi:hypothetical protein
MNAHAAPTLVQIPPGAPARRCYKCPDLIYMVGKQPIKVAPVCVSRATGTSYPTPEAIRPTATSPGLGFSHFIDCPGANELRKRS